MSNLTLVLIGIGVFYAGLFMGMWIRTWLFSRTSYSGTIYITHEDEKTLYSLELEDYPESIAFRKEVVFKIDTSEENVNRE
jgi:hypothetical protein